MIEELLAEIYEESPFHACEMATSLKGCLKESLVKQNKAKPNAAPTPTG